MKNSRTTLLVSLLASTFCSAALAAATAGQPAPDFTVTDINGKVVKLADLKGKHVVLEWNNPGCPFVQKHYDTNNMQGLQGKYAGNDTVWVSVNSTNAKHQDYLSSDKVKRYLSEKKATPSNYVLDADGKLGNAYGARTTPHMYIINPAGMLVYAGAIDDKSSANKEDVKTAKNYVAAALDESKAGKPVTVANTQPYGCGVKY